MVYSIPVWKMIVTSIKKTNRSEEYFSIGEIKKLVKLDYEMENVNPRTIELQIVFHCVNHQGNKHGGRLHETNPLFTTDGKGKFRLLKENEKKN